MTKARSTDGLLAASGQRRTEARRKIKKALREMARAGLAINPNAVARHAKVARKTIYNHTDLLTEIRAATSTPRPQVADPTPAAAGSSIDAGLRQQLRTQKRQYDTDVAKLKAQIKDLHQQLAVAHGEIHRLRSTQTG
ncbi:transposase [Mycobacterium gordonae]|nr:transposase [Mycobacterium gordonae]OBJ92026.1 transposase [Mycobacterium gordonae]